MSDPKVIKVVFQIAYPLFEIELEGEPPENPMDLVPNEVLEKSVQYAGEISIFKNILSFSDFDFEKKIEAQTKAFEEKFSFPDQKASCTWEVIR